MCPEFQKTSQQCLKIVPRYQGIEKKEETMLMLWNITKSRLWKSNIGATCTIFPCWPWISIVKMKTIESIVTITIKSIMRPHPLVHTSDRIYNRMLIITFGHSFWIMKTRSCAHFVELDRLNIDIVLSK